MRGISRLTSLSFVYGFAFLCAAILFLFWHSASSVPTQHALLAKNSESFGFDNIYLINLPSRTDRFLRTIGLLKFVGIHVQVFNGVNAKANSIMKTIEKHQSQLTPGEVACLLSHAAIMRDIVAKELKSALIIEDDVDFELDAAKQMKMLMKQMPQDWDVIFLGHCFEVRGSVVYDRIHNSVHPGCTHAYAVSYLGALKILSYLYIPKPRQPLDWQYIGLVRTKKIKSFSLFPPLFVQMTDESNVFPGRKFKASWQFKLNNSTLKTVMSNPDYRYFQSGKKLE